ncbi:conserved exported hypothetical protein [Candidatus Methylobacter favarea]|uniref:DUF3617 family protein n=1 Tax=Candidatus Methylobacter favarea TaxID=2707345 RepID=A0A8S0X7I1_9GAMM|nr:hypothetical protein [Candidatus Methylobacter favarea]CAA9890067.1 conserved exported hypothetical protein [Candidatus Methylobacter favarea]
MKNFFFLAIALLISSSLFAATDHYTLRDDNHVRHLKITTLNDEIMVSADVDFESPANKAGPDHCSAEISGKAKSAGENELVMKKHSETDASFCELKIQLSPNGAKIEEGGDCNNFAVGKCRFSSGGKELIRIQ